MPPKKNLICLFGVIITLTSSCIFDTGCDLGKAQVAFNSPQARYKKEVFRSLNSYIALKNFLVENKDTILAYNQGKSITTRIRSDGKKDTILNERIDDLSLFNYGPGNSIKDQIPPYLYPQLLQIYKAFNANNFYAVRFDRDGNITISITNPSEYDKDQIGIQHKITWDRHRYIIDKGDKNSLSTLHRDTMLSNGAKYTVAIDYYSGI